MYQVVVGEKCPLDYHLDPASQNILYVSIGDFDVLIWKLIVNDEMVGLNKRFHWSERDLVNLTWISVLFFVAMYFLYLSREIAKVAHE